MLNTYYYMSATDLGILGRGTSKWQRLCQASLFFSLIPPQTVFHFRCIVYGDLSMIRWVSIGLQSTIYDVSIIPLLVIS